MPVLHVKSDGSGDHTTIQAACDEAMLGPKGRWRILVHNLGSAYAPFYMDWYSVIPNWGAPPDATDYISVESNTFQQDKLAGNPAEIDVTGPSTGCSIYRLPYTRIRGLRFNMSNSGQAISFAGDNSTAAGSVIDGNLVVCQPGAIAGAAVYFEYFESGNGEVPIHFRNNIIWGNNLPPRGVHINAILAAMPTIYLDNNSIHDALDIGIDVTESSGKPANSEVTMFVRNNIITACTTDFMWPIYGSVSDSRGNHSSDGTATGGGGSGNVTGISASDQYIDPVSNWHLKDTADAVAAGVTLAEFDNDCRKRFRLSPWDAGAVAYNTRRLQSVISS